MDLELIFMMGKKIGAENPNLAGYRPYAITDQLQTSYAPCLVFQYTGILRGPNALILGKISYKTRIFLTPSHKPAHLLCNVNS